MGFMKNAGLLSTRRTSSSRPPGRSTASVSTWRPENCSLRSRSRRPARSLASSRPRRTRRPSVPSGAQRQTWSCAPSPTPRRREAAVVAVKHRAETDEDTTRCVADEVLEGIMKPYRCAVFCSDRPVVVDSEFKMHPSVWQTLKPMFDSRDGTIHWIAVFSLWETSRRQVEARYVPRPACGAEDPSPFDMRSLNTKLQFDFALDAAGEPVSLRSVGFEWPFVWHADGDERVALTDAEMA
eukprot:2623142-Prymnesium_polylepis.1